MKFRSKKLKKVFTNKPGEKPIYVISEIGINHNGSIKTAIELIEASKKAGVDAVKFQKRNLKKIYAERILKKSNSAEWNFDYLIPLLKEVELSKADYEIIKKKCEKLNLDLIVTPYDEESAEFVNKLGVVAFKISSSDMTNLNLIKKCSSFNLPLIISTGMWTENDIKKCTNFYKKNKINYALLLTNSTYPTPYESLNLKFIEKLKKYSPVVGYSGHERGIFVPIAATAMGANIIEKHITFNREDVVKVGNKIRKSVAKGPDHKASLLPYEFKAMTKNIRALEKALGGIKNVNQAEIQNREAFAKSAVARRSLDKGEALEPKDVIFKSPGKGVFPHEIHNYYGKKLQRNIPRDSYISHYDFRKEMPISKWKKFNFKNKWGVKCRFHDFEKYKVLKPPVIEFHCSETDLATDFTGKSKDSELIVHAPEVMSRELVDLCSENERIVKKSLDIIRKTIDKTLKIAKNFPKATPKMVIHIGGMKLNSVAEDPNKKMIENAIVNFKKLKYPKNQLAILPENLPPRPWYLGGEWHQYGFGPAEDIKKFCGELDLGMTFDICHAALHCNYYNIELSDYIKKIKHLIKHAHISDAKGISGEGVQVEEGEIDFKKELLLLKNKRFSWVPEIWSGHLHSGAGVYSALKRLEKYHNLL